MSPSSFSLFSSSVISLPLLREEERREKRTLMRPSRKIWRTRNPREFLNSNPEKISFFGSCVCGVLYLKLGIMLAFLYMGAKAGISISKHSYSHKPFYLHPPKKCVVWRRGETEIATPPFPDIMGYNPSIPLPTDQGMPMRWRERPKRFLPPHLLCGFFP